MQAESRARYAERIERSIALLERNASAGQLISVDDLASAAALSSYHFHRIFRLMTGEAIGAAVSRIRIGGSLHLLDRSIPDAVAQSGYGTSQAFARAVKNRTGLTPSALQKDAQLRGEIEMSLAVSDGAGGASPPLSITMTSVTPLVLVAIRNVGDYKELNHGFGQLIECIAQQADPQSITGLYGIPHDDPRELEPNQCRFDCAVSSDVKVTPEGDLSLLKIAGGPALRMVHSGDYDEIHNNLDALYAAAVGADLSVSNEPLFIHYLDDPEEIPVAALRAEIFLPLSIQTKQ